MRRWRIPLFLLCVAALALAIRWQASSQVTRMLRGWATREVERQSDSVYHLEVGRIRFVWSLRRFTVDSLLLTTDQAANARRARPRAELTVLMRECTVSGIGLSRLLLRKGINASRLGCADVRAAVSIAERRAWLEPPRRSQGGFLVLQQRLDLPAVVPRIRVRRVFFPRVAVTLDRPAAFGGISHFELASLAWQASELVIDPADTAAALRPLFSRRAEVLARDLELHPDTASRLTAAFVRISLADSALELKSVSWEPDGTDIEVARGGPWRRDPLRARVAQLRATGVDLDALVEGSAIRARRIELDSLDIGLYSDKRRPKRADDTRHRTPQQWLAGLKAEVSIDSIALSGARFVYRERRPGFERNALLTFTDIEALATNARHVPGRRTPSRARDSVPGPDVMTLQTRSVFEGGGRLRLAFTMPLDAAAFEMTFDGALESMPGLALNPLIETIQPVRIAMGTLDGVTLRGTVSGGIARGVVVPRYHDLALRVTGEGTNGVLESGGLIGGLARTVASVRLNVGRVRHSNPGDQGGTPRQGTIYHRFTDDQTLPAFLWKATRGGILEVVLK